MDTAVLREAFADRYPGCTAMAVCRTPGRVNLIGEHTGYNGLPVLRMALAQEIRVAFSDTGTGKIVLNDIGPDYAEAAFDNGPAIAPSAPGAWENYCKAAVEGINQYLGLSTYPGMNLLVSTTLPIAAGLSSSSALVVACALAYLRVLGVHLGEDLSPMVLAEVLAEAEHYVGTRGGVMDHAAILNGAEGHACKIDFFPLRVELAPLPPGYAVVVCDSMVKVKKSGDALARYNAGPRLCSLVCALVERQLQEEYDDEVRLERLGDMWFGPLCLTLREAAQICARAVPGERTTLAEAARRLGSDPGAVRGRCLGDLPEPEAGFQLQSRLRHQLTEFRRVEGARDALLVGDAGAFGRLMNESHQSCADDFLISSAELDALVAVARDAGAVGARLTGAGFGGATVNLVPADLVDDFVAAVGRGYYTERWGLTKDFPVFTAEAAAAAGYC